MPSLYGAAVWARRVAVVVLAGVVPPVGLVQMARVNDRTAAGGEVVEPVAVVAPSARVDTPLLSARRVPTLAARVDPVKELAGQLEAVRGNVSQPGCLTVAVGPTTVFDVQGAEPVIPGSTTKLVTAAVALDVLGADARFTTEVLSVAAPDAAGAVAGDLFLVGGGDPLLTTSPYREWLATTPSASDVPTTALESLADAVKAAGVTSIAGAVVGDDGRYDRRYYVADHWPDSYRAEGTIGPSSALVVNDGYPRVPRGGAPVADPPGAAAATFAALLQERGIAVGQGARSGAAPREATALTRIESQPMSAIVRQMLTSSDNDTAELLLKEIGRVGRSDPSTAGGVAVELEKLASWGVPLEGVALFDGSGLSRDDQLTCAALTALVGRYGLDSPLVAGMSVAGVAGTLANHLQGTAAEGRLRGKTGTLSGVRALVGVFPTVDGTAVLRFSYLLQQPGISSPESAVDPYWTALVNALATFPVQADLTAFLPRPALG